MRAVIFPKQIAQRLAGSIPARKDREMKLTTIKRDCNGATEQAYFRGGNNGIPLSVGMICEYMFPVAGGMHCVSKYGRMLIVDPADITPPREHEETPAKAEPVLPAPERLRMIAACLAALQRTQGTPGFATAPDELRALADAMDGKGDGTDWIKEMVTK